MKWVGICFGLTHRWRSAKTHTGKRTLTHNVGIHTHILPQRRTWSRRAESCAPIILIQLNRLQKKNSSSGENPREEPDKTRTWWEANHLDLSQQRDTFRKLQLGASFLLHMRKKNNPGSFYLSAISCLNMKVVWATADRLFSNLIIIQTTVFMQITDPSSPFLTSFMWLDQ